jgi:hypothetical protein
MLTLIKAMDNSSEKKLEYINSDDIDESVISPDMIHVVISKYEGELNAKAISKSTYYFVTELIPKYKENCTDEETATKYYNKHQDDIINEIALKSEKSFLNIVNKINTLQGDLELESYKFKMDEIENTSDSTIARLYVKYKDNEEISFKVTIYNRQYSNQSSIKYTE